MSNSNEKNTSCRKTYDKLELTLKDVLRLSLGVPQLKQVNFVLLHSLLDMLMKKLNCENEKVYISGLEANCLEKLSLEAQTSPFAFDDKKIEIINKRFDKLDELEEHLKYVDKKLEKHFDDIRTASQKHYPYVSTQLWQYYADQCEDLCTTCDPDNVIACQLVNNAEFCKKLMKRITVPIKERVYKIEKNLLTLREEFSIFVERAKRESLKIAMVQHCIYDICEMRKRVEAHEKKFLSTVQEIQQMMNSKLDKIHAPALRKYIKDRFDEIDEIIQKLKVKKTCVQYPPLIMNGITCLSCGNKLICVKADANATILDGGHKSLDISYNEYCGCAPEDSAPTIMEHMKSLEHQKPVIRTHHEKGDRFSKGKISLGKIFLN